jgi:small redox-active disulfide protein 2
MAVRGLLLGRDFLPISSTTYESETIVKEKIMDIKVLGPGCPKCHQTEKIVREAVATSGIQASVEKVTDVMEIAGYGVFGTPAVVVDGEVKSVGKIPKPEEVLGWIQ